MDLLVPVGIWTIVAGLLTAFAGGLPLGSRWPSPAVPKRLQAIGAGIFVEGVALASFPSLEATGRIVLGVLAMTTPLVLWGFLRRSAIGAPTAPAGVGKKLAYTVGGIAACVGIFLVATPGCACLSPAETARLKLKAALQRVADAQQAHFDSTGRYSPSLDTLGVSGATAWVRFEFHSDTSFRLAGDAGGIGDLACNAEVTPSRPLTLATACRED